MNNEAVYIGETADAVRVAELVWGEDYLAAVTLLRAMAEKGQAAEAAGWAAKILRALPEYKAYLADVLALNLDKVCGQAYAQDDGYRRYIGILYSSAAQSLEQSGFTTEAERLRGLTECFCRGDELHPVSAASEPENATEESLNEDVKIDDYISVNTKELSDFVAEIQISEESDPVTTPQNAFPETEEPVLSVADIAEEYEISEPVIQETQPEPKDIVEADIEADAAVEETIVPPVDTITEDDDKINIDNILNINPHEIDEHFEKMKQLTSEAVRKAERQVQKLKNKIHGSPKTAETLAMIKNRVRQASAKSVRKMAELAPAMQKLKGFAGKFKFKKKDAQN